MYELTWITSGLAAGQAPMSHEDLDSIRAQGIDAIVNLCGESVTISRGDRISQLVVAPVTRASFIEAEDLSASDRGEGGFGSTGV